MIGAAIGGALKIGSSIFGGISASKAMKKVRNNLQEQQRENQNWYDREYNRDPLATASAQRVMQFQRDALRSNNRRAAAAAAVGGATAESEALAKQSAIQSLGDATANISINAEARRDNVDQQYRAQKSDLNSRLNDMEMKRANAVSQAVQGAAQAGSEIANAFNTTAALEAALKKSADAASEASK